MWPTAPFRSSFSMWTFWSKNSCQNCTLPSIGLKWLYLIRRFTSPIFILLLARSVTASLAGGRECVAVLVNGDELTLAMNN